MLNYLIFFVTTHQNDFSHSEGRFQADLGVEICEFFGSHRYGCDYQNCHVWVCNSTNLAKWLIIIDVQERQEFFFIGALKEFLPYCMEQGNRKDFAPTPPQFSNPYLYSISLLPILLPPNTFLLLFLVF